MKKLNDKLSGGYADEAGVTEEDVDPEQLRMGIEVEYEHTDDEDIAKEIALDHLTEIPDYYTRLEKMEQEAKSKMSLRKKRAGSMEDLADGLRSAGANVTSSDERGILFDYNGKSFSIGTVGGVGGKVIWELYFRTGSGIGGRETLLSGPFPVRNPDKILKTIDWIEENHESLEDYAAGGPPLRVEATRQKIADMLSQEFDVFDVWSLNEAGELVLPTESSEHTLVPGSDNTPAGGVHANHYGEGDEEVFFDESYFLERVAGTFSNELLPLIQNAYISKGIDVSDKREAVSYLREIGEEDWAEYVEQVSDAEWKGFVERIEDDRIAMASRDIYDFVLNSNTYKAGSLLKRRL